MSESEEQARRRLVATIAALIDEGHDFEQIRARYRDGITITLDTQSVTFPASLLSDEFLNQVLALYRLHVGQRTH